MCHRWGFFHRHFTKLKCARKFETRQMDLDEPPDGLSAEEFHAFVDIDASLECHGILTDEDICASVRQDTDPQPDSEEEISEDPSPAPKSRDVILALCTLRAFMEQHTADFSTFYKIENQMQKLITSKAKQCSIRDFFKVPYPKSNILPYSCVNFLLLVV